MDTVLVTGAAGFIGSHVAKHLLGMKYKVVALDDFSGGYIENIPHGVVFEQGSITDHDFVNALFKQYRFSYVFHLAAYAAEGLSHFIRRYNYETNLIGSVNLINAAVNSETVKCFVFTSSIAVYGANQVPMLESMVPSPEDPYGISKYAVEMDLENARRMFGLNYVIFRPHNVYGENQNIMDPYRNAIGIFIKQCLQNKPVTIFGDGMQRRAFSHIDNVAPVIAHSIEKHESWNQVYNIGADKDESVLDMAKIICGKFGLNDNIEFLDARKEVMNAYSSHDKAKSMFKEFIGREIGIEEGLDRMIDWVKRQKHFISSRKFAGIEIEKNMPPSWK